MFGNLEALPRDPILGVTAAFRRDPDPGKVDRLPPHAIEAEQGVLRCVLLSPNDTLGLCVERFRVGADVFYELRHRLLYELLLGMYESKEAIDLLTVQQRLRDRNQLDAAGGLGYLSSLCDAVPSAASRSPSTR